MTIAKISEISAASTESFEDAIRKGIARAAKTLRHMRSAWVKEQSIEIDNGQVIQYRVILKVTFVLDD
jgi:hypothetical protein